MEEDDEPALSNVWTRQLRVSKKTQTRVMKDQSLQQIIAKTKKNTRTNRKIRVTKSKNKKWEENNNLVIINNFRFLKASCNYEFQISNFLNATEN